MGYTPDVVTGVWVGVDNISKKGTGMTGGTVPAKIWKDVMLVATEPYGNTKFDYPPVEINYAKLPPKVTLNPTEYLDQKDAQENEQEEELNNENTDSIEAPKIDLNSIKPINNSRDVLEISPENDFNIQDIKPKQ